MAQTNTNKKTAVRPRVSKKRALKAPTHKSFQLSKKVARPTVLPKARVLLIRALKHLWKYKKVFLGITVIYLVATILFVKGFGSTSDLEEIKEGLEEIVSGTAGQFTTGIALFGFLVGNASGGVSSDIAGAYQSVLLILVSLALIWALRQTHASTIVGIRESFYKGMYPLIPFLTVLLVIGLQCIPLAIGSWLFNATVMSGLAVTPPEQVLWSILCFLLALLTVYMVSSSVFALYIATLPDMTPMKALRSARELVRNRRWQILRKVLFLPCVILVVGACIMVPIILLITPFAEWVFFVLSMAVLAITHGYFYNVYRELL